MNYEEYKLHFRWAEADIKRAWNSRVRCNKCHLCEDPSTGYIRVSSRGATEPKILVVGEAPGYEESKFGQAFVGRAAQHGESIIKSVGIDLRQVRFTNTTRCFPHDEQLKPRTPDFEKETKHCVDYLYDEIDQLKPKVIVSLGAYASKVLLGKKVSSITKISGVPHNITVKGENYLVVPCVHFSADLRSGGRYLPSIAKAFGTAFDLINDIEVPVATHILNSDDEATAFLYDLLERYEKKEIKYIAYDLEYDVLLQSELLSRSESNRLSTLDVFDPEKKLVAASFATSSKEGYCIPLYCEGSNVDPEKIGRYIGQVVETIPVICHNYLKAEGHWTLSKVGTKPKLYFDTMLASYVLHMKLSPHGLKPLAKKWLGWPDWSREIDSLLEQLPPEKRSFRHLPIEELGKYSAIDPAATWGLWEIFEPKIEEEQLKAPLDLLHRASIAFLDIEHRGAFLDLDFLKHLNETYPMKLKEAYEELLSIPEVEEYQKENEKRYNPNSSVQVGDVLYGKLGCRIVTEDEEVKKVGLPCELLAGSTTMPWPFENQSPKTLWIAPCGEYQAERLKVISTANGEVVFKTPTKSFHPRTAEMVLGSPRCNELAIVTLLKECVARRKAGLPRNEQAYKFLAAHRRHKKLGKIISSYVKKISNYLVPTTNQLVFNYLLHITATGRLATRDFSLQTLPRKSDIRRLFVSKWKDIGGLIASMDQSQMEMRCMAVMADDERLIQLYLTCKKCNYVGTVSDKNRCQRCGGTLGDDLHRRVASLIWKIPPKEVTDAQRSFAKTIGFGIIYGRGAQTIAKETDVNVQEAQEIINEFFNLFPSVRRFVDDRHEEFRQTGYVRTPLGRKLYLEGFNASERWMQARGERESQNYPVQSYASDITLEGMLLAKQALANEKLLSVPWEFTHDSVEYDVYPGELLRVLEIGRRSMEQDVLSNLPVMTVPLVVSCEIGARWDGAVEVEQIDGDQIKISGKRRWYDELVAQLRLAGEVKEDIIEEGMEKEKSEVVVLKESYAGDTGGRETCKAILRLAA